MKRPGKSPSDMAEAERLVGRPEDGGPAWLDAIDAEIPRPEEPGSAPAAEGGG